MIVASSGQNGDLVFKIVADDSSLAAVAPRAEQSFQRVQKAAQQAAAAMPELRNNVALTRAESLALNYTLSDVAASLASGASPFTILLQQGGQLKDSFGGIGPLFSKLGAAISPATIGFGLLAGTVGVLSLGYLRAKEEGEAFDRLIAETGRRAGLTADDYQEMARGIDAIAGTRNGAVAALVAIQQQANVAAPDLQAFTAAAVALEKSGGQAVEKTAANFAKLADKPVAATRELGTQLGYLTPQLYEQVAALNEQGRASEAARVAQTAYAVAIGQLSEELKKTRGLWADIKDKASEAWDAMAGAFRGPTVVQRLEQVNAQLALNRARGFGDADPYGLGSVNASLQGQAGSLNRTLLNRTEVQATARATEDLAQQYANARDGVAKWADAAKTNSEKITAALKQYREQVEIIRRAGGTVTQAQQAAAERAIRDQFTPAARQEPKGKPYIPAEFQVLDARDALVLAAKRDAEDSAIAGFFSKADQAQQDRDERRLQQTEDFLQQLRDANERAAIGLLEDERARGEALIALDQKIAQRRLAAMGLEGAALAGAQGDISRAGGLAQQQLEIDLAKRTGAATYDEVRGALSAAFRDTKNPARAFADALGNAVYTRMTASITDALATALVGKSGTGGWLGEAVGFLAGLAGGGLSIDTGGYGITPADGSIPLPTRGGMAGGTNYVPQDMFVRVHKGEKIVPAKYNPEPAGGGLNVTVHNHIDARSDAAAIAAAQSQASRDAVLAVFEELKARGRL